jgi:hypothetical protein
MPVQPENAGSLKIKFYDASTRKVIPNLPVNIAVTARMFA